MRCGVYGSTFATATRRFRDYNQRGRAQMSSGVAKCRTVSVYAFRGDRAAFGQRVRKALVDEMNGVAQRGSNAWHCRYLVEAWMSSLGCRVLECTRGAGLANVSNEDEHEKSFPCETIEYLGHAVSWHQGRS